MSNVRKLAYIVYNFSEGLHIICAGLKGGQWFFSNWEVISQEQKETLMLEVERIGAQVVDPTLLNMIPKPMVVAEAGVSIHTAIAAAEYIHKIFTEEAKKL